MLANRAASNLRQPRLDVVQDEPEDLPEEAGFNDSRLTSAEGKLVDKAQMKAPNSPGSSSSGLSLSGTTANGGTSPSASSSSSSHLPTRSPLVLKNSLVKTNNGTYEDKLVEGVHSNGDSAAEVDNSSESELSNDDERQHTLVSPVTRRLEYLNKELGPDNNTLVSRDNLIKAGAILADLEKFDDDDDDESVSDILSESDEELSLIDKHSSELSGDNKKRNPVEKVAMNESELVLKRLADSAATQTLSSSAIESTAASKAGLQKHEVNSLENSDYDEDEEDVEDEEVSNNI